MAEILRSGIKTGHKPTTSVCTKLKGTEYMAKVHGHSNPKWPKLEELHNKLFGRGFEGAHDAMNDVIACKDCFFELVKLGIIKL